MYVRSRFLARDIGLKGEISALKEDLQKKPTMKPVCYLSQKHVYLNNTEKMNVARAIQVLSPAAITASEHVKEQAGHMCSTSFATAGHTITFMRNFYRWFILLDTSNTTQNLHQKFPDVRHYDDAEI